MRIGITDSGTGGLSVCAEVESRLRAIPCGEDLEILYLNAAFQDDYSYNSLETRQEKVQAFERFLTNVAERYQPDFLYIACNSLSVLYEDPAFDHHREHSAISGIVETGTRDILTSLGTAGEQAVVIFATPTTVAEGSYPRRLERAGVHPNRVVQQACPGLPDAISNDFSGEQAKALLKKYIPEAIARLEPETAGLHAFLGCTHYGYQAGVFDQLLRTFPGQRHIINPNRSAAGDILEALPGTQGSGALRIRFITPYAIPEKPLSSLTHYLSGTAPETVAALHGHSVDRDLYRS